MADERETPGEAGPDRLEMPAPTAVPFVMAVGITLLAAGVVTNLALTLIGAVLFVGAAATWAWLVFVPKAGIEHVAMAPPDERALPVIEAAPGMVEPLREGYPGHRILLPEKMHPYSAGAKGGFVGAFTMTIPAMVYGIVSGHGIWYPINLLAGMVMSLPHLPDGALDVPAVKQFRLTWFLVGASIHGVTSVTLGLIYGVLLPMLPGRPMLWGGVVAPLLWTGGMYGFMGVLDPDLNRVIDWPSFAIAQFVYGLTVGFVVLRSEKVYVTQ